MTGILDYVGYMYMASKSFILCIIYHHSLL